MQKNPVTFEAIQEAARRLKGHIRKTPLVEVTQVRSETFPPCQLFLKLENHQVTGAFKFRGALNKLLTLGEERYKKGIVAASGGNHGRAVAFAGLQRKIPTYIYLPITTPDEKVQMIRDLEAHVTVVGKDMSETIPEAVKFSQGQDLPYIHPFGDPEVINGAGTIGLEVFEEMGKVDVLVVAVGGGGMISGISTVARKLNPAVRIYGVEPEGCPTLYESLKANKIVPVSSITTKVGPLAMVETEILNFSIIKNLVNEVITLPDADIQQAARWLWKEMNILTELSGVASLAALLNGKIPVSPEDRVCAIICGAGTDGLA